MATGQLPFSVTVQGTGDLSSKQYYLMALSTAGRAAAATARGQSVDGVNLSKSTATGNQMELAVLGVTKVAAGDSSAMANAIVYGTRLISSSIGQAVPSTANVGNHIVGYALDNLSTGSTGIIRACLIPNAMSSSA
jgi:hypothetical protein